MGRTSRSSRAANYQQVGAVAGWRGWLACLAWLVLRLAWLVWSLVAPCLGRLVLLVVEGDEEPGPASDTKPTVAGFPPCAKTASERRTAARVRLSLFLSLVISLFLSLTSLLVLSPPLSQPTQTGQTLKARLCPALDIRLK